MIYLDNNATTQLEPRVYIKHCETLRRYFGNASSLYPLGIESKQLIDDSREKMANFINADLKNGDQIIFTSCATESNNAVFHSIMDGNPVGKRVIISAVEHPSVLNTALYYKQLGCEVVQVQVDSDGKLNTEQLLNALSDNTALISIMMVNSETGVINDIAKITELIRSKHPVVPIHTDAVQAAGKIVIDAKDLNVDYITLSGHKFHAPKGIGILFIRSGAPFNPFFLGGHQESGLRAGTENIAGIVALGEAAFIAQAELENGATIKVEALRDYMEDQIKALYPDSFIFGKNSPRVGNTTNIGFKSVNGSKLVLQLAQHGICVSSGTACNSISAEPSKVLRAMQAPEEYIRSIRISLSKENTKSDVHAFISALKNCV